MCRPKNAGAQETAIARAPESTVPPRKIAEPDWATIPVHEALARIPVIDGDTATVIEDDILAHGIRRPVEITPDGQLLAGRARIAIALKHSLHVPYVVVETDGPYGYVYAGDVGRRHLTASQLHGLAVYFRPYLERERAARKVAAAANGVANLPQGRIRDEQARDAETKPRGIGYAEEAERADPRLLGHIIHGKITSDVAAKVAKIDDPRTRQAIVKKIEHTSRPREARAIVMQAVREATLAKACSLAAIAQKYTVILADPSWSYRNDDSPVSAERQYPTMPLDEIESMGEDIARISAPGAVLLLWATVPLLPDALCVVEQWGYRYKTHFIWYKTGATGMGSWSQVDHEVLVLAVRPDSIPPAKRYSSIIEAPRGKHSSKPDIVYKMVESMWPGARRIELFARRSRDGWDRWGAEAPPPEDAE